MSLVSVASPSTTAPSGNRRAPRSKPTGGEAAGRGTAAPDAAPDAAACPAAATGRNGAASTLLNAVVSAAHTAAPRKPAGRG